MRNSLIASRQVRLRRTLAPIRNHMLSVYERKLYSIRVLPYITVAYHKLNIQSLYTHLYTHIYVNVCIYIYIVKCRYHAIQLITGELWVSIVRIWLCNNDTAPYTNLCVTDEWNTRWPNHNKCISNVVRELIPRIWYFQKAKICYFHVLLSSYRNHWLWLNYETSRGQFWLCDDISGCHCSCRWSYHWMAIVYWPTRKPDTTGNVFFCLKVCGNVNPSLKITLQDLWSSYRWWT